VVSGAARAAAQVRGNERELLNWVSTCQFQVDVLIEYGHLGVAAGVERVGGQQLLHWTTVPH
jgi:hypothetical protein